MIGRSLLWNHSPSEWFSLDKKKRSFDRFFFACRERLDEDNKSMRDGCNANRHLAAANVLVSRSKKRNGHLTVSFLRAARDSMRITSLRATAATLTDIWPQTCHFSNSCL